ncbi:gibberellin 3-beta-dioxygenase 3 [Selaginella moellendorffii]|uniref:gibberellin 3-beta-dioxygenase 3 n=1 Tax=Selaginella moellendorffii TaxID=88036 RepID=UPI000D1CBD0F|nr:gibberellin 3-beta-dioxygenase 3 [Selaginella moellendorffii]|eukprot:XP_024541844.1 gibberellin 3-beta-dioxygenase 3 [Selaginella moellendorffii]
MDTMLKERLVIGHSLTSPSPPVLLTSIPFRGSPALELNVTISLSSWSRQKLYDSFIVFSCVLLLLVFAVRIRMSPAKRLRARRSFIAEDPPCPEPDLVLGSSPHSDGVGITLLLQDEVEGLQIRKNGEWKPVNSMPDAFVVNIGDILEVMSNGIYKSVEHRVAPEVHEYRQLSSFHPALKQFSSPWCRTKSLSSGSLLSGSLSPRIWAMRSRQ